MWYDGAEGPGQGDFPTFPADVFGIASNRKEIYMEPIMTPLFTAAETHSLEQVVFENGVSYLQMMENAGRACCETLQAEWGVAGKRVGVLCGKGGNGGDGLALVRHLQTRGALPFALLTAEPQHRDAQEMYRRLGSAPVYRLPMEQEQLEQLLSGCDILVDAVYGIGMRGQLPEQVAWLFETAARSPAKKAAIDIPSGVRGNDGSAAEGAFRADLTIALGCYKVGHVSLPGAGYCGKLVLRGFGEQPEDRQAVGTKAFTGDAGQCAALLPWRDPEGNKGTFGNVLNIAGSRGMSGAALLSTKAALRTGPGLVRLATAQSLLPVVGGALPEPVLMGLEENEQGQLCWQDKLAPWVEKASVILFGCGLRAGVQGGQNLDRVLSLDHGPLILDADGINTLAQWPELLDKIGPDCLITPHPLEFSRLTGRLVAEIQVNRVEAARRFAGQRGMVVLLKGSRTVVAHPDGRLFLNTTGNSGLAKGGSGDVLSGMIAGFAAQGVPLFEAAVLGCCLHGACADLLALERSVYGILPSDLIEILPFLLKRLEKPANLAPLS